MYILILQEEKGLHRNLFWTGYGWSCSEDRARHYGWEEVVGETVWLRGIAGSGVCVSEI